MRQYESKRSEARKKAKAKGHKLGRFQVTDEMEVARCSSCAMSVTFVPPGNLMGDALDLHCMGK